MKYLNLASGASHFLSPPAAIKNTITALEKNETFYGETEGLPALRKAISQRYKEDYAATIPAENILITSGTKQALFNLFSILLQPGDEVILPKPTWFGFSALFEFFKVKPVYLETFQEDNYAIHPEKLAALITDKTRLFILSNPGNPTGKVYSETEITDWLKVLEMYPEIKILSDEIYDLILYDNLKMPSLLQFDDAQQKFIVVNGFSKNFGMSGWRIGYLIAPSEIIKKAVHFQHATISGVNPFIQEGALAALETRYNFLPKRITELIQNREIICNWLSSQKAIFFFKPHGAYYIFADLRNLLQTDNLQAKNLTTTHALCTYLKNELHLEFVPGERFDCDGFVRITFAVPQADLQEALSRLDNFLNELDQN